jgi:glucarate dehydratase
LDWLELVASRLPGTRVYETGALARQFRELLAGRAEGVDGVDYGPDSPWRRWADRRPCRR